MTTSQAKDQMKRSVPVRLAETVDAENIASVINVAFRPAEGFFVDQDRIDVAEVLHYLDTGKFLLAESEGVLVGSVYVEMRSLNNKRQRDHAYLGLLAVVPDRQQSGL